MSAFKLISMLFPFIKEMVLGEKTVREAFKTNKMRVFMLGLIMFVFFGFAFTLPKLIRISADYVMLEKKYNTLEHQCETVHCDQSASSVQTHPVVKVPKEKKEKPETPQESVEPPITSYLPTPVTPTPVPPQDTPPPVADVPPSYRRHQRDEHSQRHPKSSSGNSPEATARYKEWKRSFDEIKARDAADAAEAESRNTYNNITNNSDLYRHP
ncbi:MAG: hypothetical protein P4L77_11395 [Sulfuriferula sp.]|nr:hypothetical protein [Sulfuriferula sp.]